MTPGQSRDERWMREALALADQAGACGEVPVGALVVLDEKVVGAAHNQPIGSHDASAHAEVLAIRAAGQALGNYRLVDTTLYVTVEPCMMCLGAMVHARIARLVFGAEEPKAGAVVSHPLLNSIWLNHQLDVEAGVLRTECATRMSAFFKARRADKASTAPELNQHD